MKECEKECAFNSNNVCWLGCKNKFYNQALEDFTRKLSVKFIELPLDDLIVADILNDVKGIYKQLKK